MLTRNRCWFRVIVGCLVASCLQSSSAQTPAASLSPERSTTSTQTATSPSPDTPTDAEMAERVRQEFLHAWQGYRQYAWGHDALKPLSKSYHDWYGVPLLMSPVDGLDTMILMGMTDEAAQTREYIVKEPVVRPRHLRQEFRDHDPPPRRTSQQLPTERRQATTRPRRRSGHAPVARLQLSDGNALRLRQPEDWRRPRRVHQSRRDRHICSSSSARSANSPASPSTTTKPSAPWSNSTNGARPSAWSVRPST